MRILPLLLGLALITGCTAKPPAAPAAKAGPEPSNILHITWGGIAQPDAGEATRHWSEWSINLIDGSNAYGWTSAAGATFPHDLNFELAGVGLIDEVVLDTTFAPVVREDGSMSSKATGSPVRRFEVQGSTTGPQGPFTKLAEGEAAQDGRTVVKLPSRTAARWVKLVIQSNWKGSGTTRLSEFEVRGELQKRGDGGVPDVTGYYMHEYGPIVLKQEGDRIVGCYNRGDGKLEGLIFGRIMRLAWRMPGEQSIGSATLVADAGHVYGFWYRDGDRMGSPWNSVKTPVSGKVAEDVCVRQLLAGR